jgi:hypothetical protein
VFDATLKVFTLQSMPEPHRPCINQTPNVLTSISILNRITAPTNQLPCSRRSALAMSAVIGGLERGATTNAGAECQWHGRVSSFGFDYPTPTPGGDSA